ncbi:MAG: hypothetical protein ACYCWW_09270 [Deltaproteobacteria bacterium]
MGKRDLALTPPGSPEARRTKRAVWLLPLLALAALSAAVPTTVTGVLLMRDVRPSNFCRDVSIPIDRAVEEAELRRWHVRLKLLVAGAVAVAVGFGGAAGATLASPRKRRAVAAACAIAIASYLAATFSGTREPWHVISPGVQGWAQLMLPSSAAPPKFGSTLAERPECGPKIAPSLSRRIWWVYWGHCLSGVLLGLTALALSWIGLGWRSELTPRNRS